MAGRPSKRNLVIKEIEEVKESPIEKEAVDISKVEEEAKEVEEALNKIADISEIVDKQLEENDGAIVQSYIVSSNEIKIAPIRTGVVKDCNGTWLNIRKAPFSDVIIGKLYNGDKVDIYEINKGFAKISATEDKWVSVAFIG